MIHLGTFVLCLVGFAALALAMDRPQEDLFGRELAASATRWLRVSGAGLLLIALDVVVEGQGWALGLVSYSGHTSLAAGVVYISLVAHQRRKAGHR